MVAEPGKEFGHKVAAQRPSRDSCQFGARLMIDIAFVIVGTLFFVACWAFTKACDKL
jgi:hypothetical protein